MGTSHTGSGVAVLKYTKPASKYSWQYNYGKSCSTWDQANQPDCANADGTPLANPKPWCAENFCYVNPDNCDKSPTPSSVFPGLEGVYFSTDTCAAKNSMSKKDYKIATIVLAVFFALASLLAIKLLMDNGKLKAASASKSEDAVSAGQVEVELSASKSEDAVSAGQVEVELRTDA
jgi:hypothetical protein